MMIRRGTWFLLILLVVAVGAAFYLNNRKAQQAAAATPTGAAAISTDLFNPVDGTPTDVKVQDTAGNSVEVGRNESGQWVLNAPTQAPADQAAAEAAATQAGSLKVISSVQLGFDVVGLDKPSYTLTIKFSGGKSHTLKVGALTPIQDGYYSSLDGGPVRIVDKPGIDALTRLLTEPPFVATLTPVAPDATSTVPALPTGSATGSPVPGQTDAVPTLTAAPSASATPTP